MLVQFFLSLYLGCLMTIIQLLARQLAVTTVKDGRSIHKNCIQNYDKLINLFKHHLKPKLAGVALIAAKTYYFGVGGGIKDFQAWGCHFYRF